jgi:heptosyltransferase-1
LEKNLLKLDPRIHKSLLVVKLSALGDVIHALPAAAALKRAYPWLKISWVTEDRYASILKRCPDLEEVVIFPREKIREAWQGKAPLKAWEILTELFRLLRGKDFSLSIDLQGLAKSAMMVFMAKAPVRLGCTGLKEGSYLFSRMVPQGQGLHAVERNLKVAEFLGAVPAPATFPLFLKEPEVGQARVLLNGLRGRNPIVGLHLGASLPQKTWPLFRWEELVEGLCRRKGCGIALLGLEKDKPMAGSLMRRAGGQGVDLTGKTDLLTLAGVLSLLEVLISADSGPLHIAAALNIPVVGLYGPDYPSFTGPYTAKKKVFWAGLSCSPCYKRPRCAPPYPCMEAISAPEVLKAAGQFLGELP